MTQEIASASKLHDAAARIGDDLCRRAYWDAEGRLCNWVARSTIEVDRTGESINPTSAALGYDVYRGTAGVALFLAQLHRATGEPEFRRVALAAMDRSIRHLGRDWAEQPSPLSFHGGAVGVAFASHRLGHWLDEPRLVEVATTLFDRVAESIARPHPLDLIGGYAGAIPALLAIGGDRDREVATALGVELCRLANRDGAIWTWVDPSAEPEGRSSVFLTGLSHGAAGIGLALLELHQATGRADFLEAALGAFAYEDSLFDPKEANWPDLRWSDGPVEPKKPTNFSLAWCHGAPGIALARIRATAIDKARASSHHAQARVAVDSTIAAIAEGLGRRRFDTTLCHGLAGLGEVALIAGEGLGDEPYRIRSFQLASILIERYSAAGDWPSGLRSGASNPSMMLGTAGIGYWFLRLLDPRSVPSLLLIGS